MLRSIEYIFHSKQHVMVPEANDTESRRIQPSSPLLIIDHLILMLRAIEFDDQLLVDTAKIDNVGSHLMLAAEL